MYKDLDSFFKYIQNNKDLLNEILLKRTKYGKENLSIEKTKEFFENELLPIAQREGFDLNLKDIEINKLKKLSTKDLENISGGFASTWIALGLSSLAIFGTGAASINQMDTSTINANELTQNVELPKELENNESKKIKLEKPINTIDVSSHQGTIDWQKVKDSGVEVAIIRIGFGWTGIDDTYIQNIEGAKSVGIKVGAYHYSYAKNSEDAKLELNHMLELLDPYKDQLDFPVYFDIEDPSQKALPNDVNTKISTTVINGLKDKGYNAGIYSFSSFLESNLDITQLGDIPVWVAQWQPNLKYSGNYEMHQYTDNGRINGIKTPVDQSYSYVDYIK